MEPLTLDLLFCNETCTVLQCGPAGREEPAELRNTSQMLTQANLIIPAVFFFLNEKLAVFQSSLSQPLMLKDVQQKQR